MSFDYPPSRTIRLSDRLDSVKQRLDELPSDDPDEEARQERSRLETRRDGLAWAVDQFGDDATVSLSAVTVGDRSRAFGMARERTVGETTASELNDWVLAACLDDAPWIDDGDDLVVVYETTTRLPPAFGDWLREQADELNKLDEGN